MLHPSTADPFKLALYKLMGKLDPLRRSVPQVTTTTKDWLWFQLGIVGKNEDGRLRALVEVLLGYGERHFDGPRNQPGSRRGVSAGSVDVRAVREGRFAFITIIRDKYRSFFLSRQWRHSGNTKKLRWSSHLRWRTMYFSEYPRALKRQTSHLVNVFSCLVVPI